MGGRAMRRLLLDTNIYGRLFADKDFHRMHSRVENSSLIIVYGFDIIRRELKAAPSVVIEGVNVRAALLRAYASFVKKEYSIEPRITELSESYYKKYANFGSLTPYSVLKNDFLIVACASVHEIPVVVSEDRATMLNEFSVRSYSAVNAAKGLKNPSFISYERFKNELE